MRLRVVIIADYKLTVRSFTVVAVLLQVDGLPEAAKPIVSLQLSSPIEEATLNEIFDPSSEEPVEGSVFAFKGVETNVATLMVYAKDADIPLGESAPHEVAPLCKLDPLDVKEKYVTELPVAIAPEGSAPAAAEGGVEESKEDPESPSAIQPVCTVTLQISYKPSPKDQREELYDLLNKTSQRKATALEKLRRISMSITRAGESPSKGSSAVTKPSVKPGFLNSKKKEPTRLEQIYERTLGPNSILRKSLAVVIISRNYLIFFGAVGFMHFKGQLLSLPPPV